ncbi:MAG TPA: FAD-dependent oxidoreductase [Candidatus Sumerlaeota bacterium]|nr:FAD-dependent oxidoreductase [Candidatus Sumerlaeota bacterium]
MPNPRVKQAIRALALLVVLCSLQKWSLAGPAVLESARQIPVIADVDVVVAGDSSAAVLAAVEAARAGARVFLATSRPYLGQDLCGTYRLWLKPGEEIPPLFTPEDFRPAPNTCPFTCQASLPADAQHPDSTEKPRLTDGRYNSARADSVQYNGDVSLVADLGTEQAVETAVLRVYQRNGDFEVASVQAFTSPDGKTWKEWPPVPNPQLGKGSFEEEALPLTVHLATPTRYVRLDVHKTSQAGRVLLGELTLSGAEGKTSAPPTPMRVKRVFDQALLDAGVQFLFGSYATELLTDAAGHPSGIVIVNTTGRQAIRAKVVVDATPRAWLTRLARARFRYATSRDLLCERVVVGGEIHKGDAAIRSGQMLPSPVLAPGGKAVQAVQYALRLSLPDDSFASYAEAEQRARDLTWDAGQLDASEILFFVPPDSMVGVQTQKGPWPGWNQVPLDAFRPAGTQHLYVLNGCADVAREAAPQMLRPTEWMRLGGRLGTEAARDAATRPAPQEAWLPGNATKPIAQGEVRENLTPLRSDPDSKTILSEERPLPVLGQYDVVVVGGGTGGAPAAIAAARSGAHTLVVEYLNGLGGVGTLGLISRYCYGNRVGFTAEVDDGVVRLTGTGAGVKKEDWNVECKMEWFRSEIRKAGGEIWFGALACGAFVRDNKVTGVVVATPQGRGVVLAKAVVDASGSALVAAAAGAPCVYNDGTDIAVQGTGLPPRPLGGRYQNTDYTFVDDSDVLNIWQSFVAGRVKFEKEYDMGQLVDTRERRQIQGEFCISPLDIYVGRTYPDTIVVSRSNFDTHGFTIHPLFMIRPPDHESMDADVPYRSLLPRGIDGVLVTGLGISAHRDSMPVLRMQPDIQNQGYAAGLAAAMAARQNKGVKAIDVKALQQQLVKKGNLPERVLTDTDPYPLPAEKIAEAVATLPDHYKGIERVLMQPDAALPALREAFRKATARDTQSLYAHLLGLLGDPTPAEFLRKAVTESTWDKGWNFKGMGQFGASLSPLDCTLIGLGRTKDNQALKPILDKVAQLGPEHEFSHFRAVALALEGLGAPVAAAQPLADLLRKPGIRGHAHATIGAALQNQPADPEDTTTRNLSLRELELARVLYRCGDSDGLAEKILQEYAHDLRGHYARYARAVLQSRKSGEGK